MPNKILVNRTTLATSAAAIDTTVMASAPITWCALAKEPSKPSVTRENISSRPIAAQHASDHGKLTPPVSISPSTALAGLSNSSGSGGVRFDVVTSMGFEGRMQELAKILKSQHQVVYARPDRLIPPEKIEVSAAKAGLVAVGGPARGQAVK